MTIDSGQPAKSVASYH